MQTLNERDIFYYEKHGDNIEITLKKVGDDFYLNCDSDGVFSHGTICVVGRKMSLNDFFSFEILSVDGEGVTCEFEDKRD